MKIKEHIYSFSNRHRSLRNFLDLMEIIKNIAVYLNLKQNATSSGWSFIITSAGNDKQILKNSLLRILEEFSGRVDFEIIVVGPKKCKKVLDHQNIRYIVWRDSLFLPGWITKKKNVGVSIAKFDKCVIAHDYVGVDEGFVDSMESFGSFDVAMCRVLLDDGRRTRDWVTWDYPEIGPAMLPYNRECTRYQYISGAFLIVQKEFYMSNKLNERLRWNEAEDIEWSKRVRRKTTFKMNDNCSVSFLKHKPDNSAPYCESWINNTRKLYKELGVECDW